jgi:hypothetical protein
MTHQHLRDAYQSLVTHIAVLTIKFSIFAQRLLAERLVRDNCNSQRTSNQIS